MNQGDVWLLESPEAKTRPALVITRGHALGAIRRVTVALVTTTLRTGPTQLRLGREEGLARDCVANFDDLTVVDRSLLTRRIGALGSRQHELCAALSSVADC